MGETPALYEELADWWPLVSAPSEYAAEAAEYERLILSIADGDVITVLELGSGGGNNASHLKRRFAMTLVDRSSEMLEVSRRLNPECEHLEGDMRTLRLGRTFDAIFIHDAIAYITTEDDLRAVFLTAFEHCRSGGGALFAPDFVRETFSEDTGHGGHDGPDRSVRFLEWRHDPIAIDTTYLVDFAFLLRMPGGMIDVRRDRHTCGLFPRRTWLDLIGDVGFVDVRGEDVTVADARHGPDVFLARHP
jgi:SAM-dependent methyltransferase